MYGYTTNTTKEGQMDSIAVIQEINRLAWELSRDEILEIVETLVNI